ncbi:MAG: TonB-dependent receptor [bacterium]|nr:TonB-dependent receptor [bacterium]
MRPGSPVVRLGHLEHLGHLVRIFAVFLLAMGASGQARAQAEDDPFAGIEEMVVVGTGASSLFQGQEVSAIAFDSDYLEAIGASDISDVAQFTPNLEIRTPFAASNPTLFIRGVGIRDFNANSSSSVAVYNDEIFINSAAAQLAQLFDVENIDVLRGPQTTTYGRNASAGTIRTIARKPTGTPGVTASVTYGRFNELSFEAAVENVIIPDMLSMRTAARWNQRDGTTKNRCADQDYANPIGGRIRNLLNPVQQNRALIQSVHRECYNANNIDPAQSPPAPNFTVGQAGGVKEWVNDTRNWGARTIIRFQHEFLDMDWQLNLHGGQNRGDARQFQLVATNQNFSQDEPTPSFDGDADQYFDADNRLFTSNLGAFVPITSPFQGNPFEGDYNSVEKEKIDLFGASLTGQMTFGDFELISITGYEWNKRSTKLNLDGSPYASLEPNLNNKSYQLTQEIRVDWDAGEGWAWQLGGMFLYETLSIGCGGYAGNGGSRVPSGAPGGGDVLVLGRSCSTRFQINQNLPELNQTYTQFTRYGSAWYKLEWEPAETFSIKGGARFNYEEKELNLLVQSCQFIVGPLPDGSNRCPPVEDNGVIRSPGRANAAAKEFGWAGDVIATWSPAADVNFYLRYARGWKGPAINGGITNASNREDASSELATPVNPEIIDSVEIGLKGEFWSNRILWNWALFYYDYQDLQVFQLRNNGGTVPVQELINAGDADILGFEMEVDVKPFEGWAPPIFEGIWIRGTFAWLDSKYTDFVVTQIVNVPGDPLPTTQVQITDFTGNQLVNSPEFSFIGFVAWPFGGDWGIIVPRVDWSFKDKVYFGPGNVDLASQDALWLFNLGITYKSPDETFEFSGRIENLTNQAYTLDVFNLSRLRGSVLHAIGDPRTYSLTMKVNF